MQHPELTFEHVIGRGSTVAIGVLCLSLVSMLLGTRDVHAKLEALVTRITADVARVIAAQRNGLAAAPADDKRHALFAGIYGIDDLLALGKAESEDLAQRAAAVRHGMASLFGALVGGTPPLPADSPGAQAVASLQPRLAAAWQAAADALGEGPGGAAHACAAGRCARKPACGARRYRARRSARRSGVIDRRRTIDRTDRRLLRGARRPRRIAAPAAGLSARTGALSPRHGAALRNGVRSACAIAISGAFWLVTGWNQAT